jgi:hypothetical protein
MTEPKLLLGLIGFSADRQLRLAEFLRDAGGAAAWQLCRVDEADAWWAHGLHARPQVDGTLRIPPAVPQERAVRLRFAELDRPLAFAEPAPAGLAPSVARFDMRDTSGMRAVLAHFEAQLRVRVAHLRLAAHMVAHERELHAGFCHLVGGGRLLAVADRRGEAGTAPGVTAADIAAGAWTLPPLARCDVPSSFDRIGIPVLMWQYALRSDAVLLPARYRTRPIHFRRVPRVPPQLQRESHLAILRELSRGPLAFDELKQRIGLVDPRLARDLAALYFTGAITTDPARAAPGIAGRREAERFDPSSTGAGFSNLTSTMGDTGFAGGSEWMPAGDITRPMPAALPSA